MSFDYPDGRTRKVLNLGTESLNQVCKTLQNSPTVVVQCAMWKNEPTGLRFLERKHHSH